MTWRVTEGTDPAGYPLSDLNHVYSVLVDTLDGSSKEIWLPCGFHGDQVNNETSSSYVRIIDVRDMKVRLGPKLPFSGGACVAAAIEVDGPGTPPHICSFGGTLGSHDTGTFLKYASCFDRRLERWTHPFGAMPIGLDHGSISVVPAGTCAASDPARVLILNYRVACYGTPRPEILAFDSPPKGWSESELKTTSAETRGAWYVYANITYNGPGDELNAPRDASGTVSAGDGR